MVLFLTEVLLYRRGQKYENIRSYKRTGHRPRFSRAGKAGLYRGLAGSGVKAGILDMQITTTQSRAAQSIQERLYRLYVEAKGHDLIVADDIKDAAESLSIIIAPNHIKE